MECLYEIFNLPNRALFISRLDIAEQHGLYCLNERKNILSYPISIFMRKDFIYKNDVNVIIQQIFESGIINFWQKGMEIREELNEIHATNISLTFEYSAGMFVFLIVGVSLSILSFIMEIIVFHLNNNKSITGRQKKILMMFNKMIDGDRHLFFVQQKKKNFGHV